MNEATSSSNLVKILLFGFVLFLMVTSCSPQEAEIPEHLNGLENLVIIQPNSKPVSSIEFIQDAVINDRNATNTWFNDIASSGFPFGSFDYWFAGLEIDDSGRIYVGNRPEKTIQIFDSTGSYLTNVGSEGNGPGEFNSILDIKIGNNQLYVVDYFQFRTTFFSLDSLELDKVKNVYLNRVPDVEELTGWLANQFMLIDDDKFLVQYMDEFRNANVGTPHYNLDKERPARYYMVDREGRVLSEMIFVLKDHKIITADVGDRHLSNLAPLPFLNQPLIYISSDGHIFAANSEKALIKMYTPHGEYLRAFYIPVDKRTLVRDELINMYGEDDEENENLLLHAELPKEWPGLGDVIVDDENRLWVSTIPDSENIIYEWWVLQHTGELLATFRWPWNRSIEKVKDGYLYARETDELTGLQTIVKYGIKIEEK